MHACRARRRSNPIEYIPRREKHAAEAADVYRRFQHSSSCWRLRCHYAVLRCDIMLIAMPCAVVSCAVRRARCLILSLVLARSRMTQHTFRYDMIWYDMMHDFLHCGSSTQTKRTKAVLDETETERPACSPEISSISLKDARCLWGVKF